MPYTVKAGDTLTGIAAANKVTVDQLVKWNNLLKPGSSFLVPKEVVVPPVDPPTEPSGSVKLSELGPYGKAEANKIVQAALNKEFGGVVVDGDWGPQTSAAYTRWQESVGESAQPWDGLPGRVSLPPLGAKYNFKVVLDDDAPGPAPTSEPAANYTRTTFGGRTVNQRTKDMLMQAQTVYGKSFPITQGSYNAGGVSASAGTHDGGGVVDIGDTSTALLKALRQVGFAAWIRTPAEGFAYHIHAVAIGDRELSPSAKNQITSYFNGRDGLAKNGPDTAPSSVGRPYPAWAGRYGAPV